MTDCDTLDTPCTLSSDSNAITVENATDSEILLIYSYPRDHGYFSVGQVSTITTTMDFYSRDSNSNWIWMIVCDNKYFVFSIGTTLGYSFYPMDDSGKLAKFNNGKLDMPNIDINNIGIGTNLTKIIELIEDPQRSLVHLFWPCTKLHLVKTP